MESQDEITTTPQNNLSDNNSEEDTSPRLNSVDTSRSHSNNSASENAPPVLSSEDLVQERSKLKNKDTVWQCYNAATSKCNVKQSVTKLNEVTDFPDIDKCTENFETDQTFQKNHEETLKLHKVKFTCVDKHFKSKEMMESFSNNVTDNSNSSVKLENKETRRTVKCMVMKTFKNNRFIEENISVYNMKGEERSLSNANGTFDEVNVKIFTTPEFMSNEAKSDKLKDVKFDDESRETRKSTLIIIPS
ncbi:hypothetical protein TNCV_111371 [Trichonephila clavipes]|nr:hypothetical protein TNCV_111371 [Trichonephila clavipes]